MGNILISEAYVGTQKVFPSEPQHDYSQDYFTTIATESGTIRFSIESGVPTSFFSSISYSTDGGNTWTTTNNVDEQEVTVNVNVNEGDKILWKGSGKALGHGYYDQDYYAYYYDAHCSFYKYEGFEVEGNIMSLLNGDNFYGTQLDSEYTYQFVLLFANSHITSAENLIFPQNTTWGCYNAMFSGCGYLKKAPQLLATTLADNCYYAMFNGCSLLTKAPKILPATTLSNNCYYQMFYNCNALTTAPELPAPTLVRNCYYQMFNGCRNLNYIKCLATNISASNCTYGWVYNVASSGTFVKAASMTSWTRGNNGIPSYSWTVQNA